MVLAEKVYRDHKGRGWRLKDAVSQTAFETTMDVETELGEHDEIDTGEGHTCLDYKCDNICLPCAVYQSRERIRARAGCNLGQKGKTTADTQKRAPTPGPWEVRTDGESVAVCGPDNWIATMDLYMEDTETGLAIDKANAHQIAASPELLAVAKAIKALNLLRPDGKVGLALEAAIAKAEGRS